MINLLKRDTVFFTLLNRQADYMVLAADKFNTLLGDFSNSSKYITEIDTIEHEADLVRHSFSSKIDTAFITPLDKEDLTALADKLDDVIDCIESTTGRMAIYEITILRDDLKPMAKNLLVMTNRLQFAVKALGESKSRETIKDTFIEIHRIENETDEMFRTALGTLFKTMRDQPVDILIWKEIYDRVERAVDKCEDAANVIESMVMKYA